MKTRSDTAHEPQLGAIFGERAMAEAAVEDLRRSGLAEEHLGVAVSGSDIYVFEEDVEAETAHGMGRGIAIGAPIGAIAGMTALALVVPGVGTLGVAGILAAGGVTGALAGGFWGAYLGLRSEEHIREEEWDWERIPLQSGQVMVVVDQHGHPDDVERILERHGGQIIAKPRHRG
ncbi:MAG TPA: hypothetical protein VLA91_04955 [Acidimicrobiia bacterium]|nr:hypothetical protein [Acidimicrobiia bacterium]